MADSPLDPRGVRRAMTLLAEASRPESLAAVTLAAALFAVSALALVFVVISLPSPWPT